MWAEHAKDCGVDVTEEMNRNDIITALNADDHPADTESALNAANLVSISAASFEKGRKLGREEGYAEGLAAAGKAKLPLFEGARQWAFKNTAKIASFQKFIDAHNAGLFDEITAEYPGEKLIRSDQELIFNAVKKHLRKQRALTAPGVELTAERKREMRRTVRDVEEVVVS